MTHAEKPVQLRYYQLLAMALCVLPVVGVLAPRSLSFLPLLVGVFGFVGYRVIFGSWLKFSKTTIFACSGVLAIMALSMLWAYDLQVAQMRSIKMLPVMAGAVLLLSVSNQLHGSLKQYWKPYFPYACIAVCCLLITDLYAGNVIYSITHPDRHWDNGWNLSHLNRAVIISVFCSIIAVSVLLAQDKTIKTWIICGTLSCLLLAILIRTHSQSAQLTMLIAPIVYFIFPYRLKNGWIVPAVIIAFFLLSAPWLAQWMFQNGAEWIREINWLRYSYAADRMEIWDFISKRILEKPWLGHGVEATRVIADFQTEQIYFKGSQILHPHNFAIQIWIEFGAIGAMLASILQAVILKKAWSRLPAPSLRFAVSLFCAVIAVAAVSYGLWQSWWQGLWVLLISYGLIAYMPSKLPAQEK